MNHQKNASKSLCPVCSGLLEKGKLDPKRPGYLTTTCKSGCGYQVSEEVRAGGWILPGD